MSEEPGRSGAQTDEERARAIREQLKSIHAVDLAYEMMVSLVSFGYQKMGLTDETGRAARPRATRASPSSCCARPSAWSSARPARRRPATCARRWRRCS